MSSVSKPRVRHNRHKQGLNLTLEKLSADFRENSYTKLATEKISKDKPVALYCRSGNRSKNAARILAEKGYEVVELGTGFRGWSAAGKKTVKP